MNTNQLKTILLAFIGLYLMEACSTKQTQTPGQMAFDRLDSLFNQLYPADEPGAAVLILKGDDIIYEKGFGIADMETKEPVTGKTFFCIASVSKQFSAVALMMLHASGR